MLCIAEKVGMRIHKDHGEVDGCLHLHAPDTESLRQEHAKERAASLDYALDGRMRNAVRWLRNLVLLEKTDSAPDRSAGFSWFLRQGVVLSRIRILSCAE